MTPRRTVLLMSRGMRLHRLMREMAVDLVRDHRVIVLAAPEELSGFAAVPGLDVRTYTSCDVHNAVSSTASLPDAELRTRARAIEHDLGLPLYKTASNYLLYGRLMKGYGGSWQYLETERHLLEAYVSAYDQLAEIFRTARPNVVFYETIDLMSTYVACALARRHGVFALDVRFAPLTNGRVAVGYGLYRKNPILEYLYRHRDSIEPVYLDAADAMTRDSRAVITETAYARIHRDLLRHASPVGRRNVGRALRDWGKVRAAIRNRALHYRILRTRPWLARHLRTTLPSGPYIFFPLAYLPEATTCAQAPRWVYQEMIVEQLAVNAPSGLKIVVKEHPRSYGRRGPEFFRPLLELPNVVVCGPAVDHYTAMESAEAVLAISGSSGLEAILLGKRAGVLGNPFYAVYRGVRRLDHPDQLFASLEDVTWRPGDDVGERREFFAAYLQSLHEFGHGEHSVLPLTGGEKWATALRRTLASIETYGLKPDDFDAGLS